MAVLGNQLLHRLSATAVDRLGELTTVSLAMRQHLDGPALSQHAYFLESGVASVIADVDGKLAVELGIIGSEGMVGLHLVYGDTESPYQTIIQVEGNAVQVEAAKLTSLLDDDPVARAVFMTFARAFSIQVASTALANGRNKLDERLARWLLMVSDRTGATFPITHEFISIMLGVRRSGVTLAVQLLEGKGLIKAGRGRVTVVDRQGLVEAAGGAYGFAEFHYKRLLG